MKRLAIAGVLGLLAAWGCSSDDSSGGNGGSGATGGTAGTAGTGSGGNAGTGASSGNGGSGGTTGGSGGIEDAGMEAALDVYVYQPCNDVCEKVKDSCAFTPMELEDCIGGCTGESLGACQTELRAYVACVNSATTVECTQGNPTSPECDAEAQAYGQCASAQN
ncbi:MAG: hypothetical protein R3B07_17415 [Polyangiaceae bacterium]